MSAPEAGKMKYDALALSWAGDKFIGTPYSELDCQAFVERCLREIGITMDLKGSNAWYRKIREEGWTGSPEECVKIFGSVPKGAFLFIHAFDGGEEKRGYHDGLGKASHIGIKTGRGEGAIHSSSSRGRVAESKFQDKTIKGGWNTVGLWNRMDYGKTINWLLEHMGIGSAPAEGSEEDKVMKVTITSPNGQDVNLRKTSSRRAALIDMIPVGTEAELLEGGDTWSRIRVNGKTGWMMTEFLVADDSDAPSEDFGPGDLDNGQDGGRVALYFTAAELGALLPVLESAVDQIMNKVGRG